MVVIEVHRHPVIGEHQEGQRARADFLVGDQMPDEGLEIGFIRNPGGSKETHNITAFPGKFHHLFNRFAPQTPPLAADHYFQVLRYLAREAQPLLDFIQEIEQPFMFAFIDQMAVDQPFLAPSSLDPVAFEKIKAFDEICIIGVQKLMGVFGGLDRHAIPRQHVEMRGARKGIERGLHGVQRCLHQ